MFKEGFVELHDLLLEDLRASLLRQRRSLHGFMAEAEYDDEGAR